MKIDILKETEEYGGTIRQWRQELHKIPECGLELPKTKQFIIERLKEMDISYHTYDNHSGVTALIGNDTGKTIAIRADMDALLITEETELSFSSQHAGKMHACGHDAHVAISLGVLAILKKYEESLNGQIKIIFQPSEELPPGGAKVMIKDGVLDNPKVDAILGLHMSQEYNGAEQGVFALKNGSAMAADDVIKLEITGQGGHASEPEKCADAILAASQIVVGLQQVISRSVSANKASVISITDFHGGTGTDNVLPDKVSILGTIRNSDEKTRQIVRKRVTEVVDGISMAANVHVNLELIPDYPVLSNDEYITDIVRHSVDMLYGEKHRTEVDYCNMGGDDFAFFTCEVPGCYFWLIAGEAYKDGNIYPAHNSKFIFNDNILYRGTAVLIQAALLYFNQEHSC